MRWIGAARGFLGAAVAFLGAIALASPEAWFVFSIGTVIAASGMYIAARSPGAR